MAKQNLDWENLGFAYMKTDKRYVANYIGARGSWDQGALIDDANIVMSEDAGVLQYAQTVFEGLKAYETRDGRIVCFRPDLNASRLQDSAVRLEMPPLCKDQFLDSIRKVVSANASWVPPYGSGATLYVRPYMFGISPVIGVKPADDYQYRVFTTPVGPYFKGGAKPIYVRITDYDRAAPHGTGNIKAGLNYAMSLKAIMEAHREGFAENIYLDPATRSTLEETGGANILLIDQEDRLVVPKSDSILPSITRRSLVYVAEHYLGMKVDERPVRIQEVREGNFKECGLCGTAAVISPIGKIYDHGKDICFSSGMEEMGPWMTKLRQTLLGIQEGIIEAPEGWIFEIGE